MPQQFRAKFDKDGKRCPDNIKEQKRLPECGILDRKEFKPENKPDPPPTPPEPGEKFDPFAPGNTIPRRFRPRRIAGDPPSISPSNMPGVTQQILNSEIYPQDSPYILPEQFFGTGRNELLLFRAQNPAIQEFHRMPTRIPSNLLEEETLLRPSSSLYEEGISRVGTSSGGLRRRLVGGRQNLLPRSRQDLFDNPTDFLGEFSDRENIPEIRQDRLPPPRGTTAFPADEEMAFQNPADYDVDARLLNPTRRVGAGARMLEQTRARATTFATNRAVEAQENMRALARTLSETSSSVRTNMSRQLASQFNSNYVRLNRRTASNVGIDMPDFDIEEGLVQEEQPFRDGPLEVEQGIPEPVDPNRMSFASRVSGLRARQQYNVIQEDRPFEVLDEVDEMVGRPTLSRRLAAASESRGGLAGTSVASMGGGYAIGYGVSKLMGGAHVDPYTTAFVSSASADVGARFLAIGGRSLGQYAARKAGMTIATDTAEQVGERVASRALSAGLKGAGKSGLIGLATVPVDMWLNQVFTKNGMNHAEANAASSGITSGILVGGAAVATALAPETFGMSYLALAVMAGMSSIGTLLGWMSGHEEDENERIQREERAKEIRKFNDVNFERQVLISLLPESNYNLDNALNKFKQKYGQQEYDKMGVGNDSWDEFSTNVRNTFSDGPQPQAVKANIEPTEDNKRINDLYQQYITHAVIERLCPVGERCDLRSQDTKGALTSDEIKFMTDKCGEIWQSQADLSVQMSVSSANYHHQLMVDSQQQLIDGWNNERKLVFDFDDRVMQNAMLDNTFLDRYRLAVSQDAEEQIINDYITSGGETTLEKQPENIQIASRYDATFRDKYYTYVAGMQSSAGALRVTIPELIELQALGKDPAQQARRYKEIQFNQTKEMTEVVSQAKDLIAEETKISDLGFYDIDSAFLQTADPTDISKWRPTDSQIIQASRAGMTLQQYTDYLSEIQKGSDADFNKIQTYTEPQLTAQGELDFIHLQDDLQLAGYRQDYYIYNPRTRTYTINPNVPTTPDETISSTYRSKFTPEFLIEARMEYARMVSQMNNTFEKRTNAYNQALAAHIQNEANNYASKVEAYNILISQQTTAYSTPLLTFDATNLYKNNKIDYHPLSTLMPGRRLQDPNNPIDVHGQNTNHLNGTAGNAPTQTGVPTTGYQQNPDGSLERVVRETNEDGTVSTQDLGQANSGELQQEFRDENPNLQPETTFTDNQIKNLNTGGETMSGGQVYASA